MIGGEAVGRASAGMIRNRRQADRYRAGWSSEANAGHVDVAIKSAADGFTAWDARARPMSGRRGILEKIADLYEAHAAEF